tara:strand:+ start:213 stop:737 length:525 start_codon:yes stop_codon:yes gene_type:complete
MPISSIAQILLRLFALNWFLSGFIQLATVIFLYNKESYGIYFWAPSFIYLIAGLVFWILAPGLSRLLTKGNDGNINLGEITAYHLYSAVFVGLGLYFALSSFAKVFSWTHFFIINQSPDYGFHREQTPSYYELTESALTLLAGLAFLLTAHIWAKKITRKQKSEQSAAPDPIGA